MKKKLRTFALMMISGLLLCGCLFGCSPSEPIVGKWTSSKGNLMEVSADGSYTYTNSTITELGYLNGSWETYEAIPVIQADGKDWNVYVFIDETREITGEGNLGNQHEYNDKYGDYYWIVNGDEIHLAIGAGNIETIQEKESFSDLQKDIAYKRS